MTRQITLLLLLISSLRLCKSTKVGVVDFKDGDVLIGYFDTLLRPGRTFTQQNMLSFLMEADNPEKWPQNATIGYVVYGSFSDEDMTLHMVIDLLKKNPKLVALVGLRTESISLQLAYFSTALYLPCFTLSISMLVDDVMGTVMSEFLNQITSPMFVQVTQTIPEVLERMNVDIVTIIYDTTNAREVSELTRVLSSNRYHIDIEHSLLFDDTYPWDLGRHTNLNQTLFNTTQSSQRLPTFLIFMNYPRRNMLLEYVDNGKGNNIMLVFNSYACSLKLSNYKNLAKSNVSMITLCQTQYKESKIDLFLSTYEPFYFSKNGSVIKKSEIAYQWYIQRLSEKRSEPPALVERNCVIENSLCHTYSDLIYNSSFSRYNHRIQYTVLKILKSLENVTKEQVAVVKNRIAYSLSPDKTIGEMINTGFRENHVKLPKGTTFLRFKDGFPLHDFEVFIHTENQLKSMVWVQNNTNKELFDLIGETMTNLTGRLGMRTKCSTQCSPGYIREYGPQFLNCWKCVRCIRNTVSVYGNETRCSKCPENSANFNSWANKNHTGCDAAPTYLSIGSSSGQIILYVSVLGIIVLTATVGIFVKYRHSQVITSSGRDLSALMFLGILVGHVEAILLAIEPTENICKVIQVCAHLFMILTVSPLLVKTIRIWLIFNYSLKMGKKLQMYTKKFVTIIEVAILAIPQMIALLVGMLTKSSFLFQKSSIINKFSPELEVSMSCRPPNFFNIIFSMGYGTLLLLITTLIGLFSRKIPENYRESLHIFVHSFISLVIVIVYVPVMINLGGYHQVFLLALVVSLLSLFLNMVLFAPRIYVVLCLPQAEHKRIYSPKNTNV